MHLSRTRIVHQPFQAFLSRDHQLPQQLFTTSNVQRKPPSSHLSAARTVTYLSFKVPSRRLRLLSFAQPTAVGETPHTRNQQQVSENRVSPLSTTHAPRSPKEVPEEAEDRRDLQVPSCRFVLCASVLALRDRQVLPANIPAERRSAGSRVVRWLLEVLQIYLVFLGCAAVLTFVTYLYIWYFEK